MIAKLTNLEYSKEALAPIQTIGKTLLFDFVTGDFILNDGNTIKVDGVDGLKVWIQKVLKTQRDQYRIYEKTKYGIYYEDLIGHRIDFTKLELEREIKEALLKHPDISHITNFVINQEDETLYVSFKVNLKNGNSFSEAVIFNV